MSEHSLRARKWPKRLAIAMLAVIIAAVVGFFAYTSDYYRPGEIATGLSEELAASGGLRETNVGITLGEADAEVGIVLYPGAKVDPRAYVPLAQELASKGYYCVIAKMPFNLAFFGIDAASGLMEAAPGVHEWWIAGHSLGGAMAAQFASTHADELEGVLLLAAYAATDLSASGLTVETAYGSNDGVLNRDALEQNAANLPSGSRTDVIEGGNHAGFGDYGPQNGDGENALGARAQWQETAALVMQTVETAA